MCVKRFLAVYDGKGMTPVCLKLASRLIRPSTGLEISACPTFVDICNGDVLIHCKKFLKIHNRKLL